MSQFYRTHPKKQLVFRLVGIYRETKGCCYLNRICVRKRRHTMTTTALDSLRYVGECDPQHSRIRSLYTVATPCNVNQKEPESPLTQALIGDSNFRLNCEDRWIADNH